MPTVTVMYPRSDDATFDMEYYTTTHFSLLRERLGDQLVRDEIYEVTHGPFLAFCHLHVDSLDGFNAVMAEHGAEVMGDVANYTNVTPTMLVSQPV